MLHKPRRVPYVLREPVEAELRKLEENGIIKKKKDLNELVEGRSICKDMW